MQSVFTGPSAVQERLDFRQYHLCTGHNLFVPTHCHYITTILCARRNSKCVHQALALCLPAAVHSSEPILPMKPVLPADIDIVKLCLCSQDVMGDPACYYNSCPSIVAVARACVISRMIYTKTCAWSVVAKNRLQLA